MSLNNRDKILSRIAVTIATSALLGVCTLAPAAQSTPGTHQSSAELPLMVAGTVGMERRQDNREERRDDRGDRRDNRQDCREEEGGAGKDKRDCKQEGRQEARDAAKGE